MAVPRKVRALAGWSWPSVVASMCAALIAGALEGLVFLPGPIHVLAGIGFAALLAVPVAFVALGLARVMWRSWEPRARIEACVEEGGGAPRYLAWVLYTGIGVGVLWHATFYGYMMTASLRRGSMHAIAISLIVLATAALVVAAARPAVPGLERAGRWLGSKSQSRFAVAILRPRSITTLAVLLILGMGAYLWFHSIKPRLGAFRLVEYVYVATFIPVSILFLWWSETRKRLASHLGKVGVVAIALCVLTALWVRSNRPFVMLDVWGRMPSGSLVIGAVHDFEEGRDVFLESVRPEVIPGAAQRDIVLITIDTVRADRMSLYGGPAKTPNLDKLASRGAMFEWAFSPSNNTRRSMSSIALGLSPARVRGRVAGWALRLDPRHVLVAERLRAAGYETVGFFCCGSHFGKEHRLGLIRGMETVVLHKGDEGLLERASTWLDQRPSAGRRPLFLWLHLIDPHLWHEKGRAKKQASGRKRYDKALTEVDRLLGPFLTRITADAGLDDTVVVVASDHGEGLGMHGIRYHSTSLYNTETRVPFIVAGGGLPSKRIDVPVSLIDLAPTIMELTGHRAPAMPAMDGQSLLPLLEGKEANKRPVFSYQIRDRSVERSLRSVVADGFKLIVGEKGGDLLYELESDVTERKNLLKSKPAVRKRLEALLDERLETVDSVRPF